MESSGISTHDTELKIPDDFSFPFPPYKIQIDFMKTLFEALDRRKLGIFESPTGTGKSLSLLCGSLTWLERREQQRLKDLKSVVDGCNLEQEEIVAKEAKNWVVAQHAFRQRKEKVLKAIRELQFLESLIEQRKKCLQKRKQLKQTIEYSSKGNRLERVVKDGSCVEDPLDELTSSLLNDEFGPEPYSDSEFSEDDDDGEEKEPEFHSLKVIFGSRTHSQLSQFVNELKKTLFASKITSTTLGSRQNLCVNAEVSRLKSLSLINERCLDLQKGSKGKKKTEGKKQKTCTGCPYFNQTAIQSLKNQILSEPMDIEELVHLAKKEKACAYYASRKASKEAQLILLPYNSILHLGTRDGIGLRIENSVVILDEAHNIVESISNMYSSSVSLTQLQESLKGLKTYTNRYMTRFNGKNLLKLKQITHILKSFIAFLNDVDVETPGAGRVFYVQEFISVTGVEALDLHSLYKYMIKSKLIFKLKGYLQLEAKQKMLEMELSISKPLPEAAESESTNRKSSAPGQVLLNFFEFLKSITRCSGSGRIIQDGKMLKFLLLNTVDSFSDVVNSARSIILAGGTIKPYEDVEDQLFYGAKDRISHFSCNHVIPDENLICLAVSHGSSSSPFDFTFKNRNSHQLIQELCQAVLNISRVVPGGLVIFLPSYDYESKFYSHLVESGIFTKIELKKKIFREPRESNCEKILTDYTRQIRNNSGGAVLFAVVGGKLSEGINFADDLGRCVIVVGLPYPNIMSMEIKQKIQFITEKFGLEKGKQLLPNSCFKAVNQSIGRAIRHANDYAAIILLDNRYLSSESQTQLPDWIRKKYISCNDFGKCIGTLSKFFSKKLQKSQPQP